jgi:hypothetical protein
MNIGLTIAFICNGDTHPTFINYKLFGNKYWDDTTRNNNSKIGYYFAYYFRQKYVYVHKIVNILQPSERPKDMQRDSNRQILCLSKQIKKFTWNEWISGLGAGAPYTPNYRMTQTDSWSYSELQNHKKYNMFNFINFKNIIDQQPANIAINNVEAAIVEEDDDMEAYMKKQQEKMEAFIKAEQAETDRIMKQMEAKKIAKSVGLLREQSRDALLREKQRIQATIDKLKADIAVNNTEIEAIMRGEHDADLIKAKTDAIKPQSVLPPTLQQKPIKNTPTADGARARAILMRNLSSKRTI